MIRSVSRTQVLVRGSAKNFERFAYRAIITRTFQKENCSLHRLVGF